MLISQNDVIYVAGHKGMVGKAIVRNLKRKGFKKILTITKKELDLRDNISVKKWFKQNKPDVVILAAAKVGGIQANFESPTEFLIDNLKIQNNVIEYAWKFSAKRLLFLGSSCIYPKFANQPIREEELLNGKLEYTNESYALAKITGIRFCEALRNQYKFDAITLMPTNLYGPYDNYDVNNGHVLAALIKKFYFASKLNLKNVECWGDGSPLREFLHVDDLADACLFTLLYWDPSKKDSPKLDSGNELCYLNVGTGIEITIKDLAKKIANEFGYTGEILWDKSKPNGTPRKLLNIERIKNIGWSPKKKLEQGIPETINIFKKEIDIAPY